jgi:hypothetical protein
MQQTSLSPLSPMTNPPPRKRHPAWGLLKGTTIVAPGVDIAKPTAPDWGKLD